MSPIVPQLSEGPFAPQPIAPGRPSFLRKLLMGRPSSSTSSSPAPPDSGDERPKPADDPPKTGLIKRMSRRVVPSLSRQHTSSFKREPSEGRECLAPTEPTADERRAASVDRRSLRTSGRLSSHAHYPNIRSSAPSLMGDGRPESASLPTLVASRPMYTIDDESRESLAAVLSAAVKVDPDTSAEAALSPGPESDNLPLVFSPTTEQSEQQIYDDVAAAPMTEAEYEDLINHELEQRWILNLSMHFRDRSKREKFFVTFRQEEFLWRRVTVSLDYREAPLYSLEHDLLLTKSQKEKSARIYDAIRESLPDIQFYETVTNLKLETTDGRLHVHVIEDGNEIIHYPLVNQIRYLGCRRIRERDVEFVSHMSGFVYKVRVNGVDLIKKEIPGPDTIDEFLYEVNALNTLRFSEDVIHFHGIVVDDNDEHVKGLLISYAEQGALIDIIYERCKEKHEGIPWTEREKWARQIVQGLADIHESGFVQGDFTLSNIVIDGSGDAKIIDINRRGCPVGWEPPEATDLIDTNQRLTMYIGVKSDLYQLGMVLWSLAMMEDEPEAHGHPLTLGPEVDVPDWFRRMTEMCLSDDPRLRPQASSLLSMFPRISADYGLDDGHEDDSIDVLQEVSEPLSDGDSPTLNEYSVDRYHAQYDPAKRDFEPSNVWSQTNTAYAETESEAVMFDPYYESERRGRSPPSPMSLNYLGFGTEGSLYFASAWAANRHIPSSYSDSGEEDGGREDEEEAGLEAVNEDTDEGLNYIIDDERGDPHEQEQHFSPDHEDVLEALRDPTPTPLSEKLFASEDWMGIPPAETDVSDLSPEAEAEAEVEEGAEVSGIADPAGFDTTVTSSHFEISGVDFDELDYFDDAEAEKASVRMSTYTARSDAASTNLQEAIQIKIVNFESSKNLNIISTEGAARSRSPTKRAPIQPPSPSPFDASEATHEEARDDTEHGCSQRPRVVEVVSMDRRSSEDSIASTGTRTSRSGAARGNESETEPEYTTSPDRGREARKVQIVGAGVAELGAGRLNMDTDMDMDMDEDFKTPEEEFEEFRFPAAGASAVMISREAST